MKRWAILLLAASLSSAGFIACNSAGSGNSGAAAKDPAPATGSATESSATPVVSGPEGAIGTVTGVAGAPLPQGFDVDYTGGTHSAPVFTWKKGTGETASLADYRGKVVMLNFWGTWCPPCRRELPDIVRLRDDLAPKGFEVIGVAIGERPPVGVGVAQHLANFAGNNDLRYPLVVGDNKIVTHYGGIAAVPTTFIINKEGKVVNMLVGGMSEAQFRRAVEAAM